MEIIIVIVIVVLAIYFKRKYDYSKLTPEQKHIKAYREDPTYREVWDTTMKEGRKIKEKLDKEWQDIYGEDVRQEAIERLKKKPKKTVNISLMKKINITNDKT